MTNNKGFSLTEILVTVGILSIMSGIATMTYRKHDTGVQKRELRQAGRHFAHAVSSCVQSNRGWKINRPGFYDHDGDPDTDEIPNTMTPCDADDQDDDLNDNTDCGTDLACELKEKLGFKCPDDATCAINSRPYDGPGYDGPMQSGKPIPNRVEYYCLSIQKTVSGKDLQVLVTIPKNSVSYYKVFCKEGFLTSTKPPDGVCRGKNDPNDISKQKDIGLKCCDWHCTTPECRDDIAKNYNDNNKC